MNSVGRGRGPPQPLYLAWATYSLSAARESSARSTMVVNGELALSRHDWHGELQPCGPRRSNPAATGEHKPCRELAWANHALAASSNSATMADADELRPGRVGRRRRAGAWVSWVSSDLDALVGASELELGCHG